MNMRLAYTLVREWSSPFHRPDAFAGLEPEQRFFLLSDGSTTLNIELLFGGTGATAKKAEAEVIFTGIAFLDVDAAEFIGERPGQVSLEREVWLSINGKRLLYAQTIIPRGCIEKGLLKALERQDKEPLGSVLNSRNIPFAKDRFETGVLRCPMVADGLGLGNDIPLMARRYILYNKTVSGPYIIKAAITEIFGREFPALSTAPDAAI